MLNAMKTIELLLRRSTELMLLYITRCDSFKTWPYVFWHSSHWEVEAVAVIPEARRIQPTSRVTVASLCRSGRAAAYTLVTGTPA